MITVKIVRLPGTIKSVSLPDGSTVADALVAADVTAAANEVTQVNGIAAGVHTILNDGDRVVMALGAKGNAVENLTLVYGQNAKDLSDDALIASINRLSKEIDANKEVLEKVESTKVAARVESLTAERDSIVAILDSRE